MALDSRSCPMVSAAHTLHAISDEKALSLFKTIAVSKSNTDILMTKLKLTRKQYYSRMKMLVDVGLVKRGSGKYYLTSFGRIAYEFYTRIQNGVNNYWKIKAIDSFESSSDTIPKEERVNLINALLGNDNNNKLKRILVNIDIS